MDLNVDYGPCQPHDQRQDFFCVWRLDGSANAAPAKLYSVRFILSLPLPSKFFRAESRLSSRPGRATERQNGVEVATVSAQGPLPQPPYPFFTTYNNRVGGWFKFERSPSHPVTCAESTFIPLPICHTL